MKNRCAALLLAVALLANCGSETDDHGAARNHGSSDPAPFTIVLSGDTRGFIVPCGCASKQLGGLPRRGGYLQGVTGEVLYLDAGGSAARSFEYDRLKVGFIWRGMQSLGVDAANLGSAEIAFGRTFLQAAAEQTKIPFVSTNVVADDVDGAPAAARERVVKTSGASIAVLGVCSTRFRPGAGLKVLEPSEALREPVRRLRGSHDLLILLAHAPEDEVIALAEAYPEFDAVLVTGQTQPIAPKSIEGRTILAGTGVKGKFLAVLPWTPAASPRSQWTAGEGRIVEMADTLPEHPEMMTLLREYQNSVRQANLTPEQSGEVAALLSSLPGDYRYAGSAKCGTCHSLETEIWKNSHHAHGLETLHKKGFESDPYCVRCHTTGYGGPGGYRTLPDALSLGGIGCESCHGPSQAHAASPLAVKPPAKARDACITCHDPENSPTFDFEKYWPKIIHGKDRKPKDR